MAGDPSSAPASADTLATLTETLAACFAEASEKGPFESADAVIGGTRLRFSFAGEGVAKALRPSIEPLLTEPEGEPDARFGYWDSALSTPSLDAFDEVPRTGGPEQIQLIMVRASDGSVATHEPDSGSATAVDIARRHGYHVFPGAENLLWWERAAPARLLFHTMLATERRWMLHGGAVATPGGPAALIVGRGGSGKSTLSLASLAHGLDYLGDDYVLAGVDEDEDAGGSPWVRSLYATAKVTENTLGLVPGIGMDPVASGTGEMGLKHVLDVGGSRPGQLRARAPLAAIIVPRIVGGAGARLEPLPAPRAVLALAPSTTFQMPDREGGALRMAGALARRAPAYALELGDDPADGARAVAELLEGHV